MPLTKTTTPHDPPSTILGAQQYQQKLTLRQTLGCRFIDALSHGHHEGIAQLYIECALLDECLERTWRYRRDYVQVVLAAEEQRFHTPGRTHPTNHLERPCSWCRRDASGVPAGIALPAHSMQLVRLAA